jgi:hypothetical protein
MSLDVSLTVTIETKCPHCGKLIESSEETVYSANITHNLSRMAAAAGIYKHLWHPDEVGIETAGQLVEPLKEGLQKMIDNPSDYKKYNASNGWGMYEHFIPWIKEYIEACEIHIGASVHTST